MRLKKYFPDFFSEHKSKIWIVSVSLFVSMVTRTVVNFMLSYSPSFLHFAEQNSKWYNLFTIIICDLVPIILQLFTLVFGFIRSKNERKEETDNQI